MLPTGLYEQIISKALDRELAISDKRSQTAPIDDAEAAKVLAKYVADIVERGLENVKDNGAYLEEGYAMGLGKPVIQVCRKGVTPHFDTAQKNTIVFETEGELSEKLTKRIKATIE